MPIWSTKSGEKLHELPTKGNVGAFSPGGQTRAIGESDFYQALVIWPLANDAASSLPAPPVKYARVDCAEENTHYRGEVAAELADKWTPAWGDARHGLQYGVAFTTPTNTFRVGERVRMAAFFRNASDKPLQLDVRPDMFGNLPQVTSAEGNPIDLTNRLLLGGIAHYRDTLQPSEVFGPLYLNFGLGENPRPGKQNWAPFWKTPELGMYRLQHQVPFDISAPGVQTDTDDSQWTNGKLTSGVANFEVIDQGAATAIGGPVDATAVPATNQEREDIGTLEATNATADHALDSSPATDDGFRTAAPTAVSRPTQKKEGNKRVETARAKSLGLKSLDRVMLRGKHRSGQVIGMHGIEGRSASALWQARGKPIDESKGHVADVVIAWEGDQIIRMFRRQLPEGASRVNLKLWNGTNFLFITITR